MAYVLLSVAILVEVVATSLIKSTDGFTKLLPTAACLGGYAISFTLLAQAVKEIPVGVAYAMWSGLGTVAVVAIGIVLLDEGITATKVVGVALVVVGVVALNLGGAQ